jgi:hypothetical protein
MSPFRSASRVDQMTDDGAHSVRGDIVKYFTISPRTPCALMSMVGCSFAG